MNNFKDSYNSEDISINEILFLRKPMNKILERIKDYNGITPNMLTVFSIVFALIVAVFFMLPGRVWLFFGGILLVISYLFDCADGRLARLKRLETYFGFWLDRIGDQIKLCVVILSLGLRAYFIDTAGSKILIVVSLVIIIQLIKEFNWALFEIFILRSKSDKDYSQVILDSIGMEFTKETFFKKIVFRTVRIVAFLHYEQIFVLSVFPVLITSLATIYLYGFLSLVSFIGRIKVYSKIYLDKDKEKR